MINSFSQDDFESEEELAQRVAAETERRLRLRGEMRRKSRHSLESFIRMIFNDIPVRVLTRAADILERFLGM